MFAVLHIADFSLHAVLRTEHENHNRPAALFASTGKKSIVLATTPAARAAGVELGMTAPQAVARCPTLLIRAPNAAAEAEARATLLAVAFTLSPAIEDTAPGLCTIDLRRSTREKFEPAAHDSVAELARLALPATAGLARTPLLALYAARAANPVLLVADEKNFLAPLPLASANPSAELAGVFANWGLRTLGDLTVLPRDDIVRRFGAEGLTLWQRAAGGDTRPLRPVIPPQTFSAAMEFEYPIDTLEPLLFLLRRFLDRLALELITSQHVAAEIELTLRLEDDTRHARSFRLPEPTADPEILFRALHTHLESLRTASARLAKEPSKAPTQKTRPARVGSANSDGYMAGAVVFGLLGIVFWPLLILAAICLFLFIFVGVFNFDPVEDGKKVEGFGVLNGLPIGCAIPLVILAIVLFAVVMAGKK